MAVAIIIVYLFNDVSNLLKYIPDYLLTSDDRTSKYMSLKNYFISILLVLMFMILTVDFGMHHHTSIAMPVYLLVIIYMVLTINIKRIFEYKLDLFSIVYNIVFTTVVVFTTFAINWYTIGLLLIPLIVFAYINLKKLSR